MDILDKVAMAVNNAQPLRRRWNTLDLARRQAHRKSARAILKAMEDPTELMAFAGATAQLEGGKVRDIYSAMIKAAIGEPRTETAQQQPDAAKAEVNETGTDGA